MVQKILKKAMIFAGVVLSAMIFLALSREVNADEVTTEVNGVELTYEDDFNTLIKVVPKYTVAEAKTIGGDCLKLTLPSYIQRIDVNVFKGVELRELNIIYPVKLCCDCQKDSQGRDYYDTALTGLKAEKIFYNPTDEYSSYRIFNNINVGVLTVGSNITSMNTYCFGNDYRYSKATIETLIFNANMPYFCKQYDPNSGYTDAQWIDWETANIKNLKIGTSFKAIGKYSFYNAKLSSLTLGSNITYLEDYSMYKLSVPKLVLPSKVSKIGNYAFVEAKIPSFSMGNGVKSIGNCAFYGFSTGTMTIPSSVTSIGSSAFYKTVLSTLNISASIKTITSNNFSGISAVKLINITTNTLTTINSYAFYKCPMVEINIPYGVTKIGDNALSGCAKLRKVRLGSSRAIYYENISWLPQDNKNITVVVPGNIDLFYTLKIHGYGVSGNEIMKLNYTSMTLLKGDRAEKLKFLNYKAVANAKAVFGTSNKNVATIDSAGNVRAVGTGKATVYIKYNGKQYNCTVNVLSRTVANRCVQLDKHYGLAPLPDYHVANALFQWMEKNCKYDYTYTKYYPNHLLLGYSAVCNAYMLSYNEVMKYFKIPCESVISWEMNHGWNVMRIGSYWYYLDATWHEFLMNESTLRKSGQGAGCSKPGHYGFQVKHSSVNNTPSRTYTTWRKAIRQPDVNAYNSASGIKVTWTRRAYSAGYYVYRRVAGKGWTRIATIKGGATTSFIDKKATAGVTYIYTVRAYNGSVVSSFDADGKACKRLAEPQLVSVSTVNGKLNVTWKKVTGATKYYVFRKVANATTWTCVGTTTGNTFTDTINPVRGTKYTYTVRAASGNYLSSYCSGKAIIAK